MAVDLEDKKDNSIYDNNQPAWHKNMQADPEEGGEPEGEGGDAEGGEGGGGGGKKDGLSPKKLKSAEESPKSGAGGTADDSPFNFRQEGKRALLTGAGGLVRGKLNSSKGKKKVLLVGGAGGGGLLFIVVAVFFLLNALKIPHFAEHIASYHFARVARGFNQSSAQIHEEKFLVDSADDTIYTAMRDRYSSLRDSTWGKLDKYRPKKVYENMRATKQLDYVYEKSGVLGREKLSGVMIDGELIAANDSRLFHPIANFKERIRFSNELDVALERSLQDYKTLVRGKVMSNIRSELGIKLQWWSKLGRAYRGLTQTEADRLALKEAYTATNEKPKSPTISQKVAETADEAAVIQASCVDDIPAGCADELLREDTKLATPVEAKIVSGMAMGDLEKAVSTISGAYAVALPMCLIYEGSLTNAGPTIEAQEAELTRSGYAVVTAADQQKYGDTTAEAVGAFNRKLGNIASTNAEIRAGGGVPDPNTAIGPQASSGGDYSIFDAIFPGAAGDFFNTFARPICPKVTNIWTGFVLGGLEALAGFFTGGSSEAGVEVAERSVTAYLKKLATELVSKKSLYRLGRDVVAIGGSTILAKMLVISKMGANYDGTARGADYGNQADQGIDLHAQSVERQALYGRAMTTPEVVISRQSDLAYLAGKSREMSTFDRYFALSNPNSLVSNVGFSLSSKLDARLPSRIISGLASTLNGANLLGGLFTNRAMAADLTRGDEYNIVQWGWTDEELGLIDSEPSYYPLANGEILEQSGKKDEIAAKYDECFTASMGKLISSGKIVREEDGTINNDQGKCSPKNLSRDNSEYGDLVFRYRLSKRNDNTLDHLTGIQELRDESAGAAGNQTYVPPTIIEGDTSDQTCKAGVDAGIGDGYKDGKLYKIRLCSVQGIVVNAQIAEGLDRLLNAARIDHIALSGTGFRTMEQQIAVRIQNGCPDIYDAPGNTCEVETARPGYSNHQMGLAVDFTYNGTTICFKLASIDCHNNDGFNWMAAHADTYGFFNYPGEAWHWSADGH